MRRLRREEQSLMNLGSIAAVFGLHLPSRTHAVAQPQSTNAGTLASALAGTTTAATTQGASPGDRINTLIDQQVSAGTLTSDQGDAVRSFFAMAAHHHHHHADAAADPTAASADTASAAAGTSAIDGTQLASATGSQPANKLDALLSFLQNLRTSLNANATYGASASSANTSGLVVNATA
jgi:hypothetical protein